MRLKSLDGLRGLAALIVLFSHLAATMPGYEMARPSFAAQAFWADPLFVIKYTPLRLLIAGRASVLLFFVLSGFVLCLSLRRDHSYVAWLVRRCCRILPPFFFAILFAAALYAAVGPATVASASAWFNAANWTVPPTPAFLAANLLMTGVPEVPTLNVASWSLVHEMRISIVFPLLVAALGLGFWTTLAVAAVLSTLALAFPLADPVAFTLALTVGYVVFFVAGAALALRVGPVVAWVRARPFAQSALLWLVALALIEAPMNRSVESLAPGLGALALIALSLASPRATLALESPIPAWLGRVSYSLYLVHVPILVAVVHLGGDRLPLTALFVVALCLSLGMAEICHRLVERPSIRLGRALSARLAPHPANAAPQEI